MSDEDREIDIESDAVSCHNTQKFACKKNEFAL